MLARGSEASGQVVRGMKVCICTPDYVYLVKNGGIGTSFHHTATILTQAGVDVTILYSNVTPGMVPEERAAVQRRISGEGMTLEFLFEPQGPDRSQFAPSDIYTVSAYMTYRWLLNKPFDVILFPDWRGLAYFCTLAKKQGLAFERTELWIQAHSTQLWHELNNQSDKFGIDDVRVFHYERGAIQYCDRLLGATAYLLQWKRDHGFLFPEKTEVLPYLIEPRLLAQAPSIEVSSKSKPRNLEIVFFGRLEKRKGLHLFLQALQRLVRYHPKLVLEKAPDITFMGKMAMIDGQNSADYIASAMKDLGLSYTINPALSSEEAVSYLVGRGALAVMPSLTDNSPLTVHECINAGIPFLAAATGGIPEIVAAEDHAHALCEASGPGIAERLADIIAHGQRRARGAVDQEGLNIPAWLSRLGEARAQVDSVVRAEAAKPLVSICVTHYQRPKLLAKTLEGIRSQTYRNFEVLVVDNDSRDQASHELLENLETAFKDLDLRLFRLPDLYAGAARNLNLKNARGEFIVFMDDDNYAHPRQLETFVRAITRSGFDALASAVIAFPPDEEPPAIKKFVNLYLPAGSGISLNLFGNSYGDANGIFRKSALQEVGGFTEDRSSWEDYEIYSKLELKGFKVAMVPEPLVYLRHSVGGVSRIGSMLGNYYRALRPALGAMPWRTFGDALLVAISPTLGEFGQLRFGDAGEAPDLKLMSYANDSVAISRLLARKAAQRDGERAAVRQLEQLAGSAVSLHPLRFDLLFADLALNGLEAMALNAPSEALPLAQPLVQVFKVRSFQPLIQHFSEEPPTLPDDLYLQGIAQIVSGDPLHGFSIWASMLAAEERKHLQENDDLAVLVRSEALRSGLQHHLEYGFEEGRPFGYVAPLHPPFAGMVKLLPSSYTERLAQLAHGSTPSATRILRELVVDVIGCGAVVAAADLANVAIEEADRRYLADNSDLHSGVESGHYINATAHWIEAGHAEPGRRHLIGNLRSPSLFREVVDVERALRGSRGPSQRFAGSLVQGWVDGL